MTQHSLSFLFSLLKKIHRRYFHFPINPIKIYYFPSRWYKVSGSRSSTSLWNDRFRVISGALVVGSWFPHVAAHRNHVWYHVDAGKDIVTFRFRVGNTRGIPGSVTGIQAPAGSWKVGGERARGGGRVDQRGRASIPSLPQRRDVDK